MSTHQRWQTWRLIFEITPSSQESCSRPCASLFPSLFDSVYKVRTTKTGGGSCRLGPGCSLTLSISNRMTISLSMLSWLTINLFLDPFPSTCKDDSVRIRRFFIIRFNDAFLIIGPRHLKAVVVCRYNDFLLMFDQVFSLRLYCLFNIRVCLLEQSPIIKIFINVDIPFPREIAE